MTEAPTPAWGSDVVAEMLRRFGIEYVALNPGASFRGLHDSLVNYLGNERPEIILCNHEEVAGAIAYGYAKLANRAMAVALHSNVGLMHASMPIFCAWAGRMPVLLLGGTGPMDTTRRRPYIDWIHTSSAQGELVRDFVKWDHQPSSVGAIPEAMLRAWHVIHQEPRGPAYLGFDATLQEERLAAPLQLPDPERYARSAPLWPDPNAVRAAADLLAGAAHPVILPGRIAPNQQTWDELVALAEALGAAVLGDWKSPVSFPTSHRLQQNAAKKVADEDAAEILGRADVILALDRVDPAGFLRAAGAPAASKLINVSPDIFATRSWSADHQELPAAALQLTASVGVTIGSLLGAVRAVLAGDPTAAAGIDARARALGARHDRLRRTWAEARERRWSDTPISLDRLVGELRSALGPRARDTIVAHAPNGWPAGSWEFERPGSYLGSDGGGGIGSGPGLAVGVALAARGSGRPVVAMLGDGDTLMAPTALWTAAHHRIPVLLVVQNNRSYFNDEMHQARVARVRGRPEERRWIGQRMDDPPVDFAALARSMGVAAFGPVDDPAALAGAYGEALRTLEEGRPALVDVRTADA